MEKAGSPAGALPNLAEALELRAGPKKAVYSCYNLPMSHENENIGSGGAGLVGLIIVGLLLWWGYNSFLKSDTWQGMYEVPTSNKIGVVKFDSKDDCSNWLEIMQSNPTPRSAYNFECGSNCKPPGTDIGLYRCEETFDS